MAQETRRIDISEMTDAPAWLNLVDEVRKSHQAAVIRAGGEDAVEIRPARKRRPHSTRGKSITADDSLWNIVGMAQSEGLHDGSANHDRYLAEWELSRQR